MKAGALPRIALTATCLTALCLALNACSTSGKPFAPREKVVFGHVYRQHAPEPVYNRVRWVHLPEPLPSADIPGANAPAIKPVVHLELKNVPIADAATTLASTARYKSFVESSLFGRKVTFDSLGTLDELALQLSRKEGITIEVDHEHRLVRFMAKEVQPSFYRGEVALNEHQSNN